MASKKTAAATVYRVTEIIKSYLSKEGKPYLKTTVPTKPGEDIIHIAANWFNDRINERGPRVGGGHLGEGAYKVGTLVSTCVHLSDNEHYANTILGHARWV